MVQAHFRRRHVRGRRPALVRGAAPLVYAEGGAWRLLAQGEAAWVGGAELAGLWEMLGEDGQALGAVVQGAQEPPFMVRFHAKNLTPPPPQRPRTLTLSALAHAPRRARMRARDYLEYLAASRRRGPARPLPPWRRCH